MNRRRFFGATAGVTMAGTTALSLPPTRQVERWSLLFDPYGHLWCVRDEQGETVWTSSREQLSGLILPLSTVASIQFDSVGQLDLMSDGTAMVCRNQPRVTAVSVRGDWE